MAQGSSCSQKTLVFFNSLGLILSIGLLGASLYAFLGDLGDSAVVVQMVPDWGFYSMFALSGMIMLITLLGCCGASKMSKGMLGIYSFFVFLLLLGEATIAGVLIVNYYDLEDDIGGASTVTDSLTVILENQVVFFAISNIPLWFGIQQQSACCGYNFRATFDSRIPDKQDELAQFYGEQLDAVSAAAKLLISDAVNSGVDCTAVGFAAIELVKGTATEYTEELGVAAKGNPVIGQGTNYFCEETLLGKAEPYYLYAGIAAGVIAFVLLICFISAIRLMCCTSSNDQVDKYAY